LVSEVSRWTVMNQGFEAGKVMAGGNWEWGVQERPYRLVTATGWLMSRVADGHVGLACGTFACGLDWLVATYLAGFPCIAGGSM